MRASHVAATTRLKASYTVTELAQLADVSRFKLWRMILAEDVRTIRTGRSVLVPLVALRVAFPDLWESMVIKLGLTPITPVDCTVCGATSVLGKVANR
jgi:hypothetical protein